MQKKDTITLKRTLITDVPRPVEIEVMESCKQADFKCQCHAFKTVMTEYKIIPSQLANWTLQRGRGSMIDVREGRYEAKAADVYGVVRYIEVMFGGNAAAKARAVFDEWMPKDMFFRATRNARKTTFNENELLRKTPTNQP